MHVLNSLSVLDKNQLANCSCRLNQQGTHSNQKHTLLILVKVQQQVCHAQCRHAVSAKAYMHLHPCSQVQTAHINAHSCLDCEHALQAAEACRSQRSALVTIEDGEEHENALRALVDAYFSVNPAWNSLEVCVWVWVCDTTCVWCVCVYLCVYACLCWIWHIGLHA